MLNIEVLKNVITKIIGELEINKSSIDWIEHFTNLVIYHCKNNPSDLAIGIAIISFFVLILIYAIRDRRRNAIVEEFKEKINN